MINKPELKSRLRLFALPTGTDYRMVEALRDNPVADITDDGNRLLYQASPDEFLRYTATEQRSSTHTPSTV